MCEGIERGDNFMARQDRSTMQLPMWWELQEANLRWWNQVLRDLTDQDYRSSIFSKWLELSASTLQAWNRVLVPGMGTPVFAQALSEVMENYLAMYNALSKMGQVSTREFQRMSRLSSAEDATRNIEYVINLEDKIDRLTDEVDRLTDKMDRLTDEINQLTRTAKTSR